MDVNQIISLLDAGFTGDQIKTIVSLFNPPADQPAAPSAPAAPEDQPTPAAAPVQAVTEQTPAQPQAAAAPAAIDMTPVLAAIQQLTAAVQTGNLRGASQPEIPPITGETVLANIIKPTHKKGDK